MKAFFVLLLSLIGPLITAQPNSISTAWRADDKHGLLIRGSRERQIQQQQPQQPQQPQQQMDPQYIKNSNESDAPGNSSKRKSVLTLSLSIGLGSLIVLLVAIFFWLFLSKSKAIVDKKRHANHVAKMLLMGIDDVEIDTIEHTNDSSTSNANDLLTNDSNNTRKNDHTHHIINKCDITNKIYNNNSSGEHNTGRWLLLLSEIKRQTPRSGGLIDSKVLPSSDDTNNDCQPQHYRNCTLLGSSAPTVQTSIKQTQTSKNSSNYILESSSNHLLEIDTDSPKRLETRIGKNSNNSSHRKKRLSEKLLVSFTTGTVRDENLDSSYDGSSSNDYFENITGSTWDATIISNVQQADDLESRSKSRRKFFRSNHVQNKNKKQSTMTDDSVLMVVDDQFSSLASERTSRSLPCYSSFQSSQPQKEIGTSSSTRSETRRSLPLEIQDAMHHSTKSENTSAATSSTSISTIASDIVHNTFFAANEVFDDSIDDRCRRQKEIETCALVFSNDMHDKTKHLKEIQPPKESSCKSSEEAKRRRNKQRRSSSMEITFQLGKITNSNTKISDGDNDDCFGDGKSITTTIDDTNVVNSEQQQQSNSPLQQLNASGLISISGEMTENFDDDESLTKKQERMKMLLKRLRLYDSTLSLLRCDDSGRILIKSSSIRSCATSTMQSFRQHRFHANSIDCGGSSVLLGGSDYSGVGEHSCDSSVMNSGSAHYSVSDVSSALQIYCDDTSTIGFQFNNNNFGGNSSAATTTISDIEVATTHSNMAEHNDIEVAIWNFLNLGAIDIGSNRTIQTKSEDNNFCNSSTSEISRDNEWRRTKYARGITNAQGMEDDEEIDITDALREMDEFAWNELMSQWNHESEQDGRLEHIIEQTKEFASTSKKSKTKRATKSRTSIIEDHLSITDQLEFFDTKNINDSNVNRHFDGVECYYDDCQEENYIFQDSDDDYDSDSDYDSDDDASSIDALSNVSD